MSISRVVLVKVQATVVRGPEVRLGTFHMESNLENDSERETRSGRVEATKPRLRLSDLV